MAIDGETMRAADAGLVDLQLGHNGERTSYLTAEEVQAAQALHKRAPYAMCNVSQGFFSLARHYGGLTYNGCGYTYIPAHDELVRDDVIKLVNKMRKKSASKQPTPAQQPALDFGA